MDDHPATPGQVLYQPGCEPEDIRQKIQRLKDKLDSAYPDKVVTRLHNDHKKWGETVTKLYRQLGYPDGKSFLAAYGYTVQDDKGGRPTVDAAAIINELKKRYANGPTCTSTTQLLQQNPELAPKLKSLSNQATKLFGMSLAKYLKMEGILINSTAQERRIAKAEADRQQALEAAPRELEKLRQRYVGFPYQGAVWKLWWENDDINQEAVRLYAEDLGLKVEELLSREGIWESQEQADQRRLNGIITALKNRPLPPLGVKEIIQESGVPDLERLIRSQCAKPAREYLQEQGLLYDWQGGSPDDEMEKITAYLRQKYGSAQTKPSSVNELRAQLPDLPVKSLYEWTRYSLETSVTEYLLGAGVLDMSPARLWAYEDFRFWSARRSDHFDSIRQAAELGREFFITGQRASQEELEQVTERVKALGGGVGKTTLGELDCIVGVNPGENAWARRLEFDGRALWILNSTMLDKLLNQEGGNDHG